MSDYDRMMKELESSEEQRNGIERVVKAKNLFGRLGLSISNVPIDPSDVRSVYKKLARLLHPDKCSLEGSTNAFQLLAEAFEELYDIKKQKQYALSLRHVRESKKRKTNGKHEVRHEQVEKDIARWKNCSWSEFMDQLGSLEQRESYEKSLRLQFVQNKSLQFSRKHSRHILLKCKRVCIEMDEKADVESNELWELCSPYKFTECDEEIQVSIQYDEIDLTCTDEEIRESIERLCVYLKNEYYFCVFCGALYESMEEFKRFCPGPLEDDH